MLDPIGAVLGALRLAAIPAGVMFLLSVTMYKLTAPPTLVAALQHLAAGIVMSAIATELVPIILDSPNSPECAGAIAVGFAAALLVFFLLGAFCDVEVDEDGEVVSTPITPGTPLTLAPVPPARSKIGHMERAKGWAQPQSAGAGEQAPLLDGSINDKVPLQPSEPDLVPMVGPIPPFPVSLLVAVVVDAFVDGFLIGISSASGSKAGVIMTIALTIEMGFLGMTFASTLSKQPLRRSLPSIVAPPLMLIVGSATGAGSAAAVSHLPAVHVGLVSFGVAALLYLVTEELLLEAHENCHAHKWWIDMWFFVGFMASFILAKVTG